MHSDDRTETSLAGKPVGSAAPPGVVPQPRRWGLPAFFLAWTLLAALASWWLLAHEVVVPEALKTGTFHAPQTVGERLVGWFMLAHVNLHRAYPWLLLAPYVVWLGVRFHFEKRLWLWRVPLLLAVGVGFVLAAQEFTDRLRPKLPAVVIVSATSNVEHVRFGTQTVSVVQSLPDAAALRELELVMSNLPLARPAQGRISIQTVLHTNLMGGAAPACLPPGAAPEEIVSLISSNLPVGVRMQVGSLALGQKLRTADWSAGLDGLAYVALIGLAHAGLFHRRYREREQQAVLLENRLSEARLRTLQAQLQPHFLFNALNGIATLVRRDPVAAEDMLMSLSDLLRLALGQSGRQEIPLRDEMEFLNRYLEIQQMRFRDKLSVEQAIEPAALDCAVPALLLQPIVENAIRHGLEPSPEPGVVRLAAKREGGRLVLSVEDNGIGLGQARPANGTGVGLANVRERLAALYPHAHDFQFGEKPGGGVAVRISIPWRAANQPAPDAGPSSVS